jgi:hypothetical protein
MQAERANAISEERGGADKEKGTNDADGRVRNRRERDKEHGFVALYGHGQDQPWKVFRSPGGRTAKPQPRILKPLSRVVVAGRAG